MFAVLKQKGGSAKGERNQTVHLPRVIAHGAEEGAKFALQAGGVRRDQSSQQAEFAAKLIAEHICRVGKCRYLAELQVLVISHRRETLYDSFAGIHVRTLIRKATPSW